MSVLNLQPDLTYHDWKFDSNFENITSYSCNLPYETFLREHMISNVPCLIKSLISGWPGLNWTVNNNPNFEFLIERFGNALVPVANCGVKYYNAQEKVEQTLEKYLDYWKTYKENNYSSGLPCLYLKDWHFTREFPEENIYRVPQFFASDWLNEYFTAREDVRDDYRFVYMGPKGSWTPLHADVFSSFSWSVNLCGKKRWILFPPGQEQFLKDKHGNLAYDVEVLLKENSDFPNYDKLESSFDIIQNAGDAVFVPSGWHHQVWNLEDTISINHNWVNGCNVGKMWSSLRDNLTAVKSEISDCRDMDEWEEQCQLVLNASYGLDYQQFCDFLLFIVRVRLKHLKENTLLKVYGDWLIGRNHLKFDIIQAKKVLLELTTDADFVQLKYCLEKEGEVRALLSETDTVVNTK